MSNNPLNKSVEIHFLESLETNSVKDHGLLSFSKQFKEGAIRAFTNEQEKTPELDVTFSSSTEKRRNSTENCKKGKRTRRVK